jgi:solute carrier family 25 phosphate transporter 3
MQVFVESSLLPTDLWNDGMQPADTLLSQINKGHGPKGSMPHRLAVLAREAGFRGLFAGLGPRMVMTAGLVSGQFLLYGAIKEGKH